MPATATVLLELALGRAPLKLSRKQPCCCMRVARNCRLSLEQLGNARSGREWLAGALDTTTPRLGEPGR